MPRLRSVDGEQWCRGEGKATMPVHVLSGRQVTTASRALVGLIAVVIAVTGCAQRHPAAAPIKIASAYVMQSAGTTNAVAAYLVIANSGPADRLLSVRSSAGGQVLMVGPAGRGPSAASALSELSVPGHSLIRLDPTGDHLEIVRSGRLRQGTDITLTLVFAHAGTMQVPAQVNNPAVNEGGYLGP
jgi:copper(I)-binding protein